MKLSDNIGSWAEDGSRPDEWILREWSQKVAAMERENQALREALKAVLQMADTAKPQKLDEALTWRENDEKARAMAAAALDAH